MADKDRNWATDQIMAIEAPDAVALLRRAMQGVLSTAPRPTRRHGVSGD
jgi:hypothetical protein